MRKEVSSVIGRADNVEVGVILMPFMQHSSIVAPLSMHATCPAIRSRQSERGSRWPRTVFIHVKSWKLHFFIRETHATELAWHCVSLTRRGAKIRCNFPKAVQNCHQILKRCSFGALLLFRPTTLLALLHTFAVVADGLFACSSDFKSVPWQALLRGTQLANVSFKLLKLKA